MIDYVIIVILMSLMNAVAIAATHWEQRQIAKALRELDRNYTVESDHGERRHSHLPKNVPSPAGALHVHLASDVAVATDHGEDRCGILP